MKKNLLTLLVIGLLAVSGCTENEKAKNYGGNLIVNLPTNQKLVTATWKENQLWYLCRPMRTNEVAETSVFKEKSTYGVWEGSVTFVESR